MTKKITSKQFRENPSEVIKEAEKGCVTITDEDGIPRMYILRQTEPLIDEQEKRQILENCSIEELKSALNKKLSTNHPRALFSSHCCDLWNRGHREGCPGKESEK